MNTEKLKQILKNHKLWLDNKGGKQANLSCANLNRAYLYGANLVDAILEDDQGNFNESLFSSWKESYKEAIYFFSVLKRR